MKLGALLRRSRFEREMADELRNHLDLRIDALVASGSRRRTRDARLASSSDPWRRTRIVCAARGG
jgi:hypothetical protein